ncbi:unnamed protein product [Ostreobium quekettii]|uniref:Protein kinase domain-containing protein n=1 Tax=Ostreobium quekettii TaxID=121088 RepID=A0A8S1J394_9CHLO|nr:unnamed protein product [Ostreobium quekettii]|eukprot:evm.model.scf_1838.3 EVM.evm.TU.scf_1838.3   scf_1838:26583-32398(-)
MWQGAGRRLTQQLLRRSAQLERPVEQAFVSYFSQAPTSSLAHGQSGALFCVSLAWRKIWSAAARRSLSEDRGTSPFHVVPIIFTTLAASLLGTIGIAHAEPSGQKKPTAEEDVRAILADMDPRGDRKKFGPGNSMYIASDNLHLVRKLNEGTFGQIWLGELRDGNHIEEVAVKLLSEDFLARGCLAEMLKAEAAIFHRVSTRCHHVCRLYGVACKDSRVCIVMKLYKKSLHDQLAERRGHMALCDIKKYGIQVCKGLVELHEQGVIMQDLKPTNVLIDDLDHVVLADFGMASFVDPGPGASVVTAAKGTPSYMAPEAWDPGAMGGMSTKTDIWSLGCVIIELYTGLPPWHGLEVQAIATKVKDEGQVPRIPRGLPPPLASMLRQCLSFNPDERPQAREVLEVFTSAWEASQEYADDDQRCAESGHGFSPSVTIQGSYWVPDTSAEWAPATIQGSLYVPFGDSESMPMAQGSQCTSDGRGMRDMDKDLCRAASRYAQIVDMV